MGVHLVLAVVSCLAVPQDLRNEDIFKAVGWPDRVPNATEMVFCATPEDLVGVEMPRDGHQPWLGAPSTVATVDCAGIVKGVDYGEDTWTSLRSARLGELSVAVLERTVGKRHLYALVLINRHCRCFTLRALLSDQAVPFPGGSAADDSKWRLYYLGAIDGRFRVQMDLARDGAGITGSYFYETVGQPLLLSGTIGADESVNLEERVPEPRRPDSEDRSKITGRFRGRFSSDGRTLAGQWTSADGGKARSFELACVAEQETTELVRGERLRVAFRRPVLLGSGPLAKHINRLLRDAADSDLRDGRTEIEKTIKVASTDFPAVFEEETTLGLSYVSDTLVCLRRLEYADGGGAHGNYGEGTWILHLDGGTVHELHLGDLFRKGARYCGVLSKLVLSDLKTQGAAFVVNGEVQDLKEDELSAFVPTPAGIEFSFSPYHVGSFAEGIYRVTVPYDAISSILDPESPAKRFLKARK